MSIPDDITTTKPAFEMVTIADEYCIYFESAEHKSKNGILKFAATILPLLYLKGSLMPLVEVQNPEINERYVTEEQWENIFTTLREKLGQDDEFWLIDPQYINETEPLKASISENLSDIYQDLKDLVMLYKKNTLDARQNALHECRGLFASHWGYRITNILSRLHHLNHSKEETDLFESIDLF